MDLSPGPLALFIRFFRAVSVRLFVAVPLFLLFVFCYKENITLGPALPPSDQRHGPDDVVRPDHRYHHLHQPGSQYWPLCGLFSPHCLTLHAGTPFFVSIFIFFIFFFFIIVLTIVIIIVIIEIHERT